ncbi:hypothetical protein HA402_011156 [Bradysia odoriphaga]|nr:hypothetical protein HA402_011156 [Bradysia odoriphaga]
MNRVSWSNVSFDESDEKLIVVDQEITTLPDAVVNLYHSRVRKMDLSFHQLTSLDGIEFFSRLDEYFVVSALPNLKFLDSSKVSSFERQNADELSTVEENPFLKFFDPKNIFKNFTKSRNVLYSPLPDSFRAAGEHRGIYKKCRCQYVGDQSEGNRFISNKDL